MKIDFDQCHTLQWYEDASKDPFNWTLNRSNDPLNDLSYNALALQQHLLNYKILTLPVPCIPESCIKIIINLKFYLNTSLLCLENKNKNLSQFFLFVWSRDRKGWVYWQDMGSSFAGDWKQNMKAMFHRKSLNL